MIAIAFLFVRVLCDGFKSRRRLETEILVLRHQLNVLQQRAPRRLHLRWAGRAVFIWLYRLNRTGVDIKGAYTFLSGQTGTEVSGAVGMTFNLRNTATGYRSGDELHVEGALNQHFPFGLAAGVGGYFYQQITGDYGSGDRVGPFRGRVAGVGPLRSYTFQVDKQEVTLSGRWFHEFDIKIRYQELSSR